MGKDEVHVCGQSSLVG